MADKASGRYRNFATVVYPESAPSGWLSVVGDCLVPAFVSPLHDQDFNPTGEPKKAHYHVLFCFEGVKRVDQVKPLFESFGGVGFEIVQSLRGYARYLCHLDNPEKHQYNPEDVTCFCGADYVTAIGLPTDRYKLIREMMIFCRDNNIYSYSDLLDIAAESRFDWFRVLCDSGTIVIKEYLKSRLWTSSLGSEKKS